MPPSIHNLKSLGILRSEHPLIDLLTFQHKNNDWSLIVTTNPRSRGPIMATSPTVESFWVQLSESGLIPERQVKQMSRTFAREGVDTDIAIARKLMQLGLLTRYQATRLLEGRSRGFFYDQYKLLDLLGVGGMGWVYRAQDTKSGKIFALKVLLDHLKNDHGMLARFDQEARAGLRFRHENIVRTFAEGFAGGLPYVIMEYVEGPTLLELLRLREHTRLPWEQACEIARQAALGLHHMHQAGFVHRDVKPQNLMIDHKGHVKLLDFGLTMLREGETGDEFSMAMIFGHECVGTAAFTAPEQATDSLKSEARSDVYSLGCTLYSTLIGDTPFPFDDASVVLNAHQTQIPKNVCDIVPSIPRPVGDIVAKMLEKKLDDRYATAREVADALAVWAKRSDVEFDFAKILADRSRSAREKMVELNQQSRGSSGAASSTARPATISSVASATSGDPGTNKRGISSASSIARRNPFGFEHPPTTALRSVPDWMPQHDVENDAAAKSGMKLVPLNGADPIPLLKNRFVIGRAPECDLQIQDASVSSRHCELRFDDHQWTLIDLGSRNGIRLNGDIVKKRAVRAGDTIVIGSLRLRLKDASDDLPKPPENVARKSRRWIVATILVVAIAIVTAALVVFRDHLGF